MIKQIIRKEICDITIIDDILIISWKNNIYESKLYQKTFKELLELFKCNHLTKCITDATNARYTTEEDQIYRNDYIIPAGANAGMKYLAIVLPKSIYLMVSIERAVESIKQNNVEYKYFDDLKNALEWIKAVV